MALPTMLLTEVRSAFRSCARQHGALRTTRSAFSTSPLPWKTQSEYPDHPKPFSSRPAPPKSGHPDHDRETAHPAVMLDVRRVPSGPARDLVPSLKKPTSVTPGRRSEVPMKILPKARITPELTLSAKERLEVEFLTRKPPKSKPKEIFRERLLIYHGGIGRPNLLAISKVSTILVLFGFTFVVVPAYYSYGSPWWTVALLFLGGFFPFLLVSYTTRPFVTWIHLVLPLFARQSPKAALEYSKNLPANALLRITFMRSTTLPGVVEVNIADLVPASSPWRPITFKWIGDRVIKGSWFRPNPTAFYVRPTTGTGKEARDTIPGIWENVYKRIAGIESAAVARWKK